MSNNRRLKVGFLSGLLFQSIVQNLGGCLRSCLSPLNRDPGVSLGQMISEFLKRDRHFSFKNTVMHLKKRNNPINNTHYLVRRLGKHRFLPEIRGQVAVRL